MVARRPITRSLVKQGFLLDAPDPIRSTAAPISTQLSLGERFVIALFFVVVFSVVHFVTLTGIHWYLPAFDLVEWILLIFRGFVFWFDDYEPLFDTVFALRFEQPLVILGYYTVAIHILLLLVVFGTFGIAKLFAMVKKL